MNMRRKMTALGLVLVIAATGNMTAFGSSWDNAGFETSTEVADGDAVTSTITGSVKVSNLNVTVPITAAFDIDPMQEITSGLSQISGQSTNYTITNNSTLPIYVSVSGVSIQKVAVADSATTPALVNKKDNLNAKGAVMFAVKDGAAGAPVPSLDTEGDWMMVDAISTGAKYELNATNGKLEQKPLNGTDDATNTMTMKVYCATKNGWGSGDSFAVKPQFYITATAPAATPGT